VEGLSRDMTKMYLMEYDTKNRHFPGAKQVFAKEIPFLNDRNFLEWGGGERITPSPPGLYSQSQQKIRTTPLKNQEYAAYRMWGNANSNWEGGRDFKSTMSNCKGGGLLLLAAGAGAAQTFW